MHHCTARLTRGLLVLLAAITLPPAGNLTAAALPAAARPTTQPIDAGRIAQAIADLGNPDFEARQRASDFLLEAGTTAEAALTAATASHNPEVALRARDILTDIRFGLGPGTPRDIAALIRAYRRGSASEKRSAVEALIKLGPRAYATLLRMWSAESDPRTRAVAFVGLGSRSMEMARALIADGDVNSAGQMMSIALESGPVATLRSFAEYVTIRGELPQYIQRLDEQWQNERSRRTALVLAHLHRANGDLAAAGRMAGESGDASIQTQIMLESEDWAGLARQIAQMPGDPDDTERLGFLATYQALAGHREQSQHMLDRIRALGRGRINETFHAAEALLLNGRIDDAVNLLADGEHALTAFGLLLTQQRYGQALELADRRLQKEEARAMELVLARAQLLFRLGRRDEAIATFDEVARGAGGDVNAWVRVISAEVRCRLMDRACEHAATAITHLKRDATVRPILDALYGERAAQAAGWHSLLVRIRPAETVMDQLRQLMEIRLPRPALLRLAAEAEEEVRRLPPNLRAGAIDAIAASLREANEIEAAMALLERAQAAWGRPEDVIALGDLCARERRWEQAAIWYARAHERNPSSALFAHLLGHALEQTGQRERAAELMTRASLMVLGDPRARMMLARELEQRGLNDQGARHHELMLRTAEPLSWELSTVQRIVATRLAERGEYARAAWLARQSMLACLQKHIVAAQPGTYLLMAQRVGMYQAMARVNAGQARAALEDIEASLAILPGDIDLAICLVPALEGAGLADEARRLFERCVAFHDNLCNTYPDSAVAHNALAWLLARCRRDLERAQRHALRGIELEPANTAIIDTLAEVYFQLGRREEAIATIRRCIDLEPYYERHRLALKRFEESTPQTDPPPE